tara:strand:- start:423 stop:833 length:411 start_codon:yes stop_codon:yes gene_type:complete
MPSRKDIRKRYFEGSLTKEQLCFEMLERSRISADSEASRTGRPAKYLIIKATKQLVDRTDSNEPYRKIPLTSIKDSHPDIRDSGSATAGLWDYLAKKERFDMVVEVNETEKWARIRQEFIEPLTIAMTEYQKYVDM